MSHKKTYSQISLGFYSVGEITKNGWEETVKQSEYKEELRANEIVLEVDQIVLNIGGYPTNRTKIIHSSDKTGFKRSELAEIIAAFHLESAKDDDSNDENDQFSVVNGMIDIVYFDESEEPFTLYSYLDY